MLTVSGSAVVGAAEEVLAAAERLPLAAVFVVEILTEPVSGSGTVMAFQTNSVLSADIEGNSIGALTLHPDKAAHIKSKTAMRPTYFTQTLLFTPAI